MSHPAARARDAGAEPLVEARSPVRARARGVRRRGGAVAGLALALALLLLAPRAALAQKAGGGDAPPTRVTPGVVRIEVKSKTIDAFNPRDPSQRKFGALEFRGGLELSSAARDFGGLSALYVFPDGAHFLSLSDKSFWLRARIVYDGTRPVGIADAEMAPMLGPDGRPIALRGLFDTESLAEDNGTFYVGIERANRIVKFDYARSGLLARAQPVTAPPGVSKLPYNKGLEALAVIPKGLPGAGTLIALSERGLDADGNLRGFLIGGPTPGEFSVVRHDDFDISDCAILPSGDLLILERRFTWTTGVAMRLRRIAKATIVPGARVDGEVLAFADMGFQIDNMEGLGIHRDKDGTIVLSMISDDNFSLLQRTLLLQFTLAGE